MDSELMKKLRCIGQGLIGSVENDEAENTAELGRFLLKLSDESKVDEESAYFIISAVDRLNDVIVPLFSFVYEKGKGCEWYQSLVFLFDENIDLQSCGELIKKTIESDFSADFFDDLLKSSPTQDEFEKAVSEKLDVLLKEKEPVKPEKVYAPSVSSTYDYGREFIEHLKEENTRLADQAVGYKNMISSYDKSEKQLIDQIESAQKELAGQKTSFESIQKDFSKLRSNFLVTEKKLSLAHKMIEQVKDINATLNQKFVSQEKQYADRISALKVELADTKELLFKGRDDYSALVAEKKSIVTELENLRAENEVYKEESEAFVREKENFEKSIEGLVSKINSLTEENADLNVEIKVLRKNFSSGMRRSSSSSDEEFDTSDTEEYSFLHANQSGNAFDSDFTDALFIDEDKEEYAEEDVIPISSKKNLIEKSSSFFATLLSGHFEKNFSKKPQLEQNNLIFIKLMEGNFSKSIITLVKQTVEGESSVSRTELYRLINNRSSEDEIANFCKNAV